MLRSADGDTVFSMAFLSKVTSYTIAGIKPH